MKYSDYCSGMNCKIKNWYDKGNAIKVIIKGSSDEVLLELPLTIVMIFAFFAPVLVGLFVVVALVKDCKIELKRPSTSTSEPKKVKKQKNTKSS